MLHAHCTFLCPHSICASSKALRSHQCFQNTQTAQSHLAQRRARDPAGRCNRYELLTLKAKELLRGISATPRRPRQHKLPDCKEGKAAPRPEPTRRLRVGAPTVDATRSTKRGGQTAGSAERSRSPPHRGRFPSGRVGAEPGPAGPRADRTAPRPRARPHKAQWTGPGPVRLSREIGPAAGTPLCLPPSCRTAAPDPSAAPAPRAAPAARHPPRPPPRPRPRRRGPRPSHGGVPGRPASAPALPNRKSWLGWALRREPRRRVPGEVELFFTSEEINFHIR